MRNVLLDDAVGTLQKVDWNGQAEDSCGLAVDHKFATGEAFEGYDGRFGPIPSLGPPRANMEESKPLC
jgi:hypothetical protein